MAKLVTSPIRVAAAILVGLAAPTLVLGGVGAAITGGSNGNVLLAIAALNALAMLVLGVPAWIVCHRRGVKAPTAALCGAAAGVLVGAAFSLIMMTAGDEFGDPVSWVVLGGFTFGVAAVGAPTCFAMWKIAYPKALQPPPVESVF